MKKINFVNRCGGIGESYGFASAQTNIEKSLVKAGYGFSLFADTLLAHISPHLYNREEGKRNVLWFPFEGWKLPKAIKDDINKKIDLLIASCEENKDTFIKSGVTVPIEVCQLGIDTSVFIPDHSKRKNKPFRFLWVGQADIRKGWDIVTPAFINSFAEDEDVQLYVKTTHPTNQGVMEFNDGKVIVDSRNLPTADLLDIYQSSSCFVFPSRGEGTGLPALEAMSCGCLVIAPPIMGLKDFVDETTALPLDYEIINVHYGESMTAPNVTKEMLSNRMKLAFDRYNNFNGVIENGRNRVSVQHSISAMSSTLNKILEGEK